ncbi:MAG: flagellar protein FliS [Eubacterium sp.]|nr:flagellar protein FliS [Eubacterium sp.]
MTKDKIQQYTLRITQSNRSGIIVILYEVLDTYLSDAIEAGEYGVFKENVRNASAVLAELRGALDMQYEISNALSNLYDFWMRELSGAVIKKDAGRAKAVKDMALKVGEAFAKAHEQDDSPVLMQNTQEVYAGLTYGRGDLVESNSSGGNRGYLV